MKENYLEKFIDVYFDLLWKSPVYLDIMSSLLKGAFEGRKQWNKNLESLLTILQLPTNRMQQRILYNLNTLLSEWRFEQEDIKDRLEKIEEELQNIKASLDKEGVEQ